MRGGGGKMERGALILLEGIDRCGKSTQARLLSEALRAQGHITHIINFPNRSTPIGKILDAYLAEKTEVNDHALHLMFSANRWEVSESIIERLNSGESIIMDRYIYSGIAFSAAKGLDLEWCKSSDVGLPAPDITFLLDMPIEESKHRSGFGEERYEKEEFQIKVRRFFQILQKPEWKIVDASRPLDVVQAEIFQHVSNDMARITQSPITFLPSDM